MLLLGHFCSIVTSLCLSADGKLIVSTDRDGKVRVSNLPADPLQVHPSCADRPIPVLAMSTSALQICNTM